MDKADNNSLGNRLLMSRRTLLGVLGAAAALPMSLFAQSERVLPLNTPGLDHLDIIVPDVAASAAFYMGVFNTTLHAQPFQGGQRYFVLLGELKEGREVAYVAIGDSRGRGTYIGHFCTTVYDWRRDSAEIFSSMEQSFADAGFGGFPGTTGFGGIFADPDGIEIQFLPAPDTLVTAAVPSDLVAPRQGLAKPLGLDHVHLLVSDLESAARYYSILYGSDSRRDAAGRVYFDFPASSTSLVLEQADYVYGQTPKIAHFGIKVEPFDRQALTSGLTALGAMILPADDEPDVLRFRDRDGIIVELVQV